MDAPAGAASTAIIDQCAPVGGLGPVGGHEPRRLGAEPLGASAAAGVERVTVHLDPGAVPVHPEDDPRDRAAGEVPRLGARLRYDVGWVEASAAVEPAGAQAALCHIASICSTNRHRPAYGGMRPERIELSTPGL